MAFISTYSGQKFNPLETDLDLIIQDIKFGDIAMSLSRIPRFNGATKYFYSVAQHSVMVCDLVPDELKWTALGHDFAEAYLGDIVSPLKALIPQYKEIEHRVEMALAKKFGFRTDDEAKAIIKKADLIALATEKRDLMPNSVEAWEYLVGVDPLPDRIRPKAPEMAYKQLVSRFSLLSCRNILAS